MIGISSLALSDESLEHALESIESAVDLAEIFSEGRHDLFQNASILSSYNLKYSVHAPTLDINIASTHEKIRIASLNIISDVVDLCSRAEIDTLVAHPGYFSEDFMSVAAHNSLSESLEFLKKISEYTGVLICIENMPAYETYIFKNPDDIDLKGNGFVLDVGHANTTGNLNQFLDMKIDHYHIHDNFGKADEHLAIGDGNADFSKFFEKIKYSSAKLILENKNFENAKKSLLVMEKQFLR